MTREQFLRLYFSGATLPNVARRLGLTEEEMGAALLEASWNKADRLRHDAEEAAAKGITLLNAKGFAPPPPDRVWCTQCDRQVCRAEFLTCRSKWCKAKEHAA